MREDPGRVLVAGGGTAGIAAALTLVRGGWKVVLLEASSRLGGRTYSFRASGLGGVEVDNGPHMLVGAYREFRALLGELGTEGAFLHAPALDLSFLGPGGRIYRLKARASLPSPFSLLAGLLTYKVLSFRERIRTALALGRLLGRKEPAGGTVGAWLDREGLQGGPARYLLAPLCRAVLNTREGVASLASFAAALRETFHGPPSNSALWVPERPWSRILGGPALERLRSLGVDVRLETRLEGVEFREGRFFAARTSRGKFQGKGLLLCLPPWRIRGLLPGGILPPGWEDLRPSSMEIFYVRGGPALEAVEKVPGGVLGLPPGGAFDFLVSCPGGVAAFLATPAGEGAGKDGKGVRGEGIPPGLGIPGGGRGEGRTLRLVWEKAVLHQPLGVESLRPGVVVGDGGLFLGGDWIDTGLPATLESAARSGRAAGGAFLERFGKEMKETGERRR